MTTRERGAMRLFLIEAYGGPVPTDGKIEHFTVRAANIDGAVALIKQNPDGARYATFELIEESAAFPGEQPAIIEAGDIDPGEGAYLDP